MTFATARRASMLAAMGTLVLAGCIHNQHGKIAARRLGDVSRPLAAGSPVNEIRTLCGDGAPTSRGVGVLHRRPYLQQVTTTSAIIGWVTKEEGIEELQVTTPEGKPVVTATAKRPPGTEELPVGRQMWAKIRNLQPDTVYCYALMGTTQLANRTGFRTAPSAASSEPIRFLAFGDSGGGGEDQLALRDHMLAFPFELVIHTGDLAYDDGSLRNFEKSVFAVYHELFMNLPFFPAAGNHEYVTLDAAPFREVFSLPGDSEEKWYSYDWGRIHFAALDTEADYKTQAEWLDKDLAATRAPWKIVYMHRPPYSSGRHGSDRALRKLLAPILERHGVQLVLAGHDHNYERTSPQNGIVYVVTGGGGRGTYTVGRSRFTEFSAGVIHFVVVEVDVDELTLHAIDGTGQEFDSVVVPRERSTATAER